MNIDRVSMHMPSLLSHAVSDDAVPTSWIQLFKTGSFTSNRYGRFSITPADLKQMWSNFKHIMPKPPTRLPIDFDHLSMSPTKPGDGVACGWLDDLELRNGGDQLWGKAEWTPRGADHIRNKEYQYISPSFVKDYVDTTSGKHIGATLLAAAVTNHPFLGGMESLTLANGEITGDIAVNTGIPQREAAVQVYSLAKVGDKVSFIKDSTKVPELEANEKDGTYFVRTVVDAGDQQFVRLEAVKDDGTPSGVDFGWFSTTQLGPADAPGKKDNPPSPMEKIQSAPKMDVPLPGSPPTLDAGVPDPHRFHVRADADAELIALATTRAQTTGITFGAAVKAVSAERLDLVAARDGQTLPPGKVTAAKPQPTAVSPISLSDSQRAATSFTDLVLQLEADRHLKTREAMSLAEMLRPDLARQYADMME